MEFRTVIIGAGGIANMHGAALQKVGVKIEGVYDVKRENAERLAAKLDSRAIDSVDEVLDKVNMATLLTPPSFRLEYVKKVFDAGLPLFIEKPIATTVAEAEEIKRLADEAKATVVVGFNHRYRRGYQMLYEAVKSGVLGEPVNVYVQRMGIGAGFRGKQLTRTWRTDPTMVCGMSIESLSHDINMILPLVDDKIERISANTYGTISELPNFDNNSNITFKIAGAGIGSIQSSWSSDIPYAVRGYIGTKGTALIRGNGLWDFEEFVIKTDDMEFAQVTQVNETFMTTAIQSYVNIQQHFMDCIEGKAVPMTTLQDGVNAMKFSMAILESNRTGIAAEWK